MQRVAGRQGTTAARGWLAVGLIALGWWTAAVAAPTPTQRVEQTMAAIAEVLKEEDTSRRDKWRHIGSIIDEGFDFRSMSQSVLARNWQTASKEEKRQFVDFFSHYLEEIYRSKIESYSHQRVEIVKETIVGTRAVVNTVIKTDASTIPVDYKLKNNDGVWYAYDVVIEGVSLVNNYRNTFDAIVKSEGMDGLLQDLEGRLARHRAAGEAPDAP